MSSCRSAFVLLAAAGCAAFAQQRFTAADYARAEKFMGYNTTPLVYRSGVRPNWLPDERFWYRVTTPEGSEFVLADPARATRAPAFDHARLAAALSAAVGGTFAAFRGVHPRNRSATVFNSRSSTPLWNWPSLGS